MIYSSIVINKYLRANVKTNFNLKAEINYGSSQDKSCLTFFRETN